MTVPSIDEACEALASVVDQVPGLRAKGYPDDSINPPEAHVYSREFDPRFVFGTTPNLFQLGVRVFVSRTNMRTTMRQIRDFMEPSGATSVREAIEDGDLWNVTIHHAAVTNIGQPFEAIVGDTIYIAVDFDVDVVW